MYLHRQNSNKNMARLVSSRDANSVYLKINNAKMTLGDRKIQIKIGTQELKEAFSEIEKFLTDLLKRKQLFI